MIYIKIILALISKMIYIGPQKTKANEFNLLGEPVGLSLLWGCAAEMQVSP